MNAVIKSLQTGKAPDEDDIRPEMLKAMSMYGVRWLTCVCEEACRTEQAPKQWQTSVNNTYPQERRQEKMHQL